MRINTNLAALNSYNNLNRTDSALNKSLERLSSGLRINRASDDAAGLSISEKMRGQIRGLNQAARNAQDGISLIQTAEGALNESHAILQRMRELAVQAANDTYTAADRQEIQKEIDQLTTELDRIGNTTEFNTKQLLDGTASAFSSSDKMSTEVFIRDGLRTIDQFGQKGVEEGNFDIEIEADPGVAQVQKTSQMMIKHTDGLELDYIDIGEEAGVDALEGWQVAALKDDVTITFASGGALDVNVATDTNDITITLAPDDELDAVANAIAEDDDAYELIHSKFDMDQLGDLATGATITSTAISSLENLGEIELEDPVFHGDVETLTYQSFGTGGLELAALQGDIELTIVELATAGSPQVSLDGINTDGLQQVTIEAAADEALGDIANEIRENEDVNSLLDIKFNDATGGDSAGFEPEHFGEHTLEGGPGDFLESGDQAISTTELRDISAFWDASGNFLLDDPQTIEMVQGDGSRTTVSIFGDDTVAEVRERLNDAIAEGLGQEDVLSDGIDEDYEFVSFVDPRLEAEENQLDSAEATFVIRSAVTGSPGEINFVAGEDMTTALGLSTIQDAEENQFEVTVKDAHTGDTIGEDSISGNMLVGVVHENVDVRFDNMADVYVDWDDEKNEFEFSAAAEDEGEDTYTTTVHLADNTTVFHIGANPLQDVAAAIGDMRAAALGVDNIQVTSQSDANRSISQIDRAIDQVSAERSKMGALQNRLEHTIANLEVSSENLTAAESRIRDLDMAAEMMEFTKNQIMSQAGTAMLAQANMKPQNILQLLG